MESDKDQMYWENTLKGNIFSNLKPYNEHGHMTKLTVIYPDNPTIQIQNNMKNPNI